MTASEDEQDTRVDQAWIDRVRTTRDPDLRSHMITLSYWLIASQLDKAIFRHGATAKRPVGASGRSRKPALPAPPFNANWFYFATWGTATVGRNIRNGRPPQRLDTLPPAIQRALRPYLIRERGADGQLVSRALSYAQEQMFANAAHAFIDLSAMNPADRLAIKTSPTSGQPTPAGGPTTPDIGHARLVVKAFQALYLAGQILDAPQVDVPTARTACARLVLYSSVLLTLVEQDLVDTAIRTVIESTPARLSANLRGRVAGVARRFDGIPEPVTELHLIARSRRWQVFAQDLWARFMTDQVLMMVLPTESLRLGKDIPPRSPLAPLYPEDLRDITSLTTSAESAGMAKYQPVLDDSVELFSALSRTSEDGSGAAAHDWRRLDERINWAISLFRSRQQDPTLCWVPYSDDDVRRIRSGKRPHRQADPMRLEVTPPTSASATRQFLQAQLAVGVDGRKP